MSESLYSKLKSEQDEVKEGLVASPAENMENYYERVGRIRGLQKAMDLILELARAGEDDEANR